jgi:hypothetical protein
MSIATLKRKSLAKYNNSSVNSKHGFSLNGTYRNQGYVGQTSLSRSFPRTAMKGNTEDNSVVKSSVMTSKGMISTRYSCSMGLSGPCNVVKPDNNQNSNSQWNQILRKKNCAVESLLCNAYQSTPASCTKCVNKSGHIKSVEQVFTKPESDYLSIPYSDYMDRIKMKATKMDVKYVPVSIRREPIC